VSSTTLGYRPQEGTDLLALTQRRPLTSVPALVLPRWKGLSDRVLAAFLLLALLPLLTILSLAVLASGRGGALFRQERVGLHGQHFQMLKFRTMYDGAHAQRSWLHRYDEGNGVLFKVRRDPRVTMVGRVLRRWSLDELPQLINVLRGDMSMVGPRPALPEEVAGYDAHVRRRLVVKPGLTGLWQVSGRSDLGWEESVYLDLTYVDTFSPALDARILLRTVAAVTTGRGAY
jgi:lipopolysaccharide/colanic/teichoic acid biosynthesis glycosyltransferase